MGGCGEQGVGRGQNGGAVGISVKCMPFGIYAHFAN